MREVLTKQSKYSNIKSKTILSQIFEKYIIMKKIVNKIGIEELTNKTFMAKKLICEVRAHLKVNLCEIIKEASEDYQETMKKRIADALEDNDFEAVQLLTKDVKKHVESLVNDAKEYNDIKEYAEILRIGTSLEKALEIMGHEQFIGPEDIQNTFGFMPDTVPEIPFSIDELKRAKTLGQQLILYVDTKADGTPFTVEDMHDILCGKTSDRKDLLDSAMHTKDDSVLAIQTPRLGWRLTDPEIIDNSTRKNYLKQTELLIDYLKNVQYKGVDMPQTYQEAIGEFNSQKDKIDALMDSDWQEAARMLSTLSINQLLRERSSETVYRLFIIEKKLGVRNLGSDFSWSNSLSSDGKIVGVGKFSYRGIRVRRSNPGKPNRSTVVCLSIGAS